MGKAEVVLEDVQGFNSNLDGCTLVVEGWCLSAAASALSSTAANLLLIATAT